jgi:hypothetical protein
MSAYRHHRVIRTPRLFVFEVKTDREHFGYYTNRYAMREAVEEHRAIGYKLDPPIREAHWGAGVCPASPTSEGEE